MIKILIADDHVMVRKGLKQILDDVPDMVVVDECSNGSELFSKISTLECNLVLLDISMPGRNGLEILEQLHNEKPALPVLILSMYPEEQYAVRALRAGASGYLTKMSAPDELITAIRKVYWGGRYVSDSLSERLASELGRNARRPSHDELSNREYQIMCQLASGKTVTGISDELSLSVKTVSTYRKRILTKMHMRNNAEIINYVIKHGLLE
ncbi:response regulator [Geomobilimonas luticola]|uniref:Response regulator transcription factor n=1 Tax=Geomobilimonas luticola TaxID=1114878 RepID=A0ABS5SC25_9BACT|nr:response regulator transcription factor [Geomobilimonas luticola]MBT0652912.1 response regulator transcription factor [Geomobilimonas luticola]